MAYDFYPQTNNKISTTSSGIFEPTRKDLLQTQTQTQTETQTQLNQIINKKNIIPVLLLTRLLLHIMFINLLLTSKKYKTLYDSNTKKFYVLVNVLISYVQIFVTVYALYRLKNYIPQIIKSDLYKASFAILIILFIVYIISLLQFTYILINIDEYNFKYITFLTKYFTYMQIISIFFSFGMIYKLYK